PFFLHDGVAANRGGQADALAVEKPGLAVAWRRRFGSADRRFDGARIIAGRRYGANHACLRRATRTRSVTPGNADTGRWGSNQPRVFGGRDFARDASERLSLLTPT